MSGKFQIEHVAKTPAGSHVRTLVRGKHRIRVAFSSSRAASGHVVEILHPRGENPGPPNCIVRRQLIATQKNPLSELVIMGANPLAELVVMGGNPSKAKGRRNPSYEFEHAQRYAINQGYGAAVARSYAAWYARHYPAGDASHADKFFYWIENVRRKRSRNQLPGVAEAAEYFVTSKALSSATRGVPKFKDMGRTRRRNPLAADLREEFTQRPVDSYDEFNEPHVPAGEYARLGNLLDLFVIPTWAGSAIQLSFVGKGIKVISDGGGRKIYFVSGNQDLSAQLSKFGVADSGKQLLGQVRNIYYGEKKNHDVIDPHYQGKYVQWEHQFGEVSGIRPKLYYDAAAKRMILEGGNYRVEKAGIID
jgi:hypothetical protein